jgi:hypothetical protein
MGYEFVQYIKGRFDYQHSDPLRGSCGSYLDATKAEAGRQEAVQQMAQANLRMMPVLWTYQPDSAEVAFSFSAQRTDVSQPVYKTGTEAKGFCVTEPFSQPLYVSAVFDFPQPVNLAAAEIAWMKYLGAKYGYKGDPSTRTRINPTYCSDGTRGDPARMMAARVAGAKAVRREVIETGWKFVVP